MFTKKMKIWKKISLWIVGSLALIAAVVTIVARRSGPPAAIAGLALVAAYSGGIYSIQVIPVANALLLFAAAPFMTAVLGRIILDERIRSTTWVAIIVAVSAIAIMVSDQTSFGAMTGSLAALGSAFGFAVFTVALR